MRWNEESCGIGGIIVGYLARKDILGSDRVPRVWLQGIQSFLLREGIEEVPTISRQFPMAGLRHYLVECAVRELVSRRK